MKKLIFLLICLQSVTALFSQSKKDSLWAIWSDTSEAVDNRLEAIGDMYNDGQGLYVPDNADTAFYHAQLMYDFAKKNNSKKYMAHALKNQGNYFNDKGDVKAREYFKESMQLAEEIDDKNSLAGSTYNLGLTYFKRADFSNATPLFLKASKIWKKIGKKKLESFALEKIAMMYMQQQDVKCIDYLNEAIAIREELIKTDSNTQDKMVLTMMRQTIVYVENQFAKLEESKNPRKEPLSEEEVLAKEELEKKQQIEFSEALDEIGLDEDSPLALLNEGTKALRLGAKKEAKKHFTKGIKVSEEIGNDLATSSYYVTVGIAYRDNNDKVSALPYFIKALAYAKKGKVYGTIGQYSYYLYETYESLGDYKKSLEMFQLSLSMRDSVLNIENAKAVIEQNLLADYEKQKLIDDLENEKKIAVETQKKENQQALIYCNWHWFVTHFFIGYRNF